MLEKFLSRFKPSPFWKRPSTSESLQEDVVKHIQEQGTCPYCETGLYEGPQGGFSVNLLCGSPDCNSRFNVAMNGLPWGEFTGPCPDDFIATRRLELAAKAVREIVEDKK